MVKSYDWPWFLYLASNATHTHENLCHTLCYLYQSLLKNVFSAIRWWDERVRSAKFETLVPCQYALYLCLLNRYFLGPQECQFLQKQAMNRIGFSKEEAKFLHIYINNIRYDIKCVPIFRFKRYLAIANRPIIIKYIISHTRTYLNVYVICF